MEEEEQAEMQVKQAPLSSTHPPGPSGRVDPLDDGAQDGISTKFDHSDDENDLNKISIEPGHEPLNLEESKQIEQPSAPPMDTGPSALDEALDVDMETLQ